MITLPLQSCPTTTLRTFQMPSPWLLALCSDLHGAEEPSRYWALDFCSMAYDTYLLWSVLMLKTISVLDVQHQENQEDLTSKYKSK
jgi:hypothetical protein